MLQTLSQRFAIFGLLFALALSMPAQAQYVWLNDNGSKQYSDLPPPASIPQSRILKEPGKAARTASTTSSDAQIGDTPVATETASKASEAPLTIAEKNADFQRRKMERAENEAKAAELAKSAAARTKNCERASTYQRSLQAGERIARSDQNGNRHFLDDRERAQEIQENKRILAACK